MNRGQVFIIPREDMILDEVYHEKINADHLSAMKNFSNKYKLGYEFTNNDYNLAPCMLAHDGNLVIKTVDDSSLAICYLPEVITDRQNMWFHTMKDSFSKYSFIGAYDIGKDSDMDNLKIIEGFDNIRKHVDKKNLFYEKEGNDIDAFKKI